MSTTSIEWTQNPDGTKGKTWNPIRGCSRVSAGCENCYAMNMAHRFSGVGKPFEGLTTIRRGKVDWTGSARFIPDQLAAPLSWRKPQRVFVNSMSDLFHESLSNEEIAAVFGVMAACPQHTFQVLTKRPKRAAEWFHQLSELAAGVPDGDGENRICLAMADRHTKRARHVVYQPWPLPNVWLGVSAENQKTADERIPVLRSIRALVNYRPMYLFASCEPLLGSLDLALHLAPALVTNSGERLQHPADSDRIPTQGGTWEHGLDWVIAGGESGNGARPCALEWLEALVEQCCSTGVACFVKQLGAAVVSEHRACDTAEEAKRDFGFDSRWLWQASLKDRKGGDMAEWPKALRKRQFPKETP